MFLFIYQIKFCLFAMSQVVIWQRDSEKQYSYLMPRLHLTVLTTRNETWCLWKRISKF